MAKSPAVGRPSTALVPGTPPPPTRSATTPTFFLCCESSKGCRRRVRRSQALEDGPQLLLRPPGYAERGWIVSSPLALEGPPGLLRPPFPQAAGRRRGSHRGPHRPGAVAPGLQGPATWPPHVPDNPVHSTFSLGCGPPPPSPRCLPAGPVGEDTNRGRKRNPRINTPPVAPSITAPHPSVKGLYTTLASYPLQSGLKWQNSYLILLFKKSEIHGPEVRQQRGQERPGQGSLLGQPQIL